MAADALHGPVRGFLRTGLGRVRESGPTLLQAIIASVAAYAGATYLLGHAYPVLAPIAAWVLIGLSPSSRLTKAFAMAAGNLIGVGIGETVKLTLGDGAWQLALFLLVVAFLARFLYPADIFTMQACIQGMVVMLLPPEASGGPLGRFSDAAMGLVCGLAVVLLSTADPSSRQRRAARAMFRRMESTLAHLSLAARAGDRGIAESSLTEIRGASQQLTDAWQSANDAAEELARYSPGARRFKPQVESLLTQTVGADRAMRETRILARRVASLLRWGDGRTFSDLAAALLAGEDAVRAIRIDIEKRSPVPGEATITALEGFAQRLRPAHLALPDGDDPVPESVELEGHAVVIMMRGLAVDLFESVGLSREQAQRALPGRAPTTTGATPVAPVVPTVTGSFVVEPATTTQAMRDLVSSIRHTDPGAGHEPWVPGDADVPGEPWLPAPGAPGDLPEPIAPEDLEPGGPEESDPDGPGDVPGGVDPAR
jgi:uncharacterized membrane protein YgaE (UPF0421/DUF939 family)